MSDRETSLNIAKVARGSMYDGPGPRTVVWFQGCTIRCPGCQNPELWDEGGQWIAPERLAEQVLNIGEDITLTGGEPFNQVHALAIFMQASIEKQRWEGYRDIIVYTGYELESLIWRFHYAWATYNTFHPDQLIGGILAKFDILVDGPYRAELDNDHMQWRGSANQRVIDMPLTLANGLLNSHLPYPSKSAQESVSDCIIQRDWDSPIIQIRNGEITATGGTISDLDLAELGAIETAPKCGQADYAYEAEKEVHHRQDQERRL